MPESTTPDWSAWSREAVRTMQERNDAWIAQYSVSGAPYRWNLDTAELILQRPTDAIHAGICVVGSVSASEGSFLWSWANDSIDPKAKSGIERVRAFGKQHGLALLTTPEWPGGRTDGLEMVAVSGYILESQGVWIAPTHDLILFFALTGFRVVAPRKRPWWRRSGAA